MADGGIGQEQLKDGPLEPLLTDPQTGEATRYRTHPATLQAFLQSPIVTHVLPQS